MAEDGIRSQRRRCIQGTAGIDRVGHGDWFQQPRGPVIFKQLVYLLVLSVLTVITMFYKKRDSTGKRQLGQHVSDIDGNGYFYSRGQRRVFFVSSRVLKKLHFSVTSRSIQTGQDCCQNCLLQKLSLSLRLGSSWACLESIKFLMVRHWQVFCSLSCLVAETKEVPVFSGYREEPFTLCPSQFREIEPSPNTMKREILTLSFNCSR